MKNEKQLVIERSQKADLQLRTLLGNRRITIDEALNQRVSAWKGPEILLEAMQYALFSGGKRIRPALTLAVAEAVGGKQKNAIPAACALEMIHSYSLVHDDLPAMDDDELRRGKPTVHVKFGEAIAILAGDSMLTEAFNMLSEENEISPERRIQAIRVLATAAGSQGMVGGQIRDIQIPEPTLQAFLRLHAEKTGALFVAAAKLGGIMGGADATTIQELARFGALIGKAFQLSDDLIDDIEDADAAHEEEVNIVKLIGPAETVRLTQEAIQQAREILHLLPIQSELLVALAEWIESRALAFI